MVDFVVLADHWVKLKEREKKDKYLDLSRELKKTVEHESDGDTNCKCTQGTVTKELVQSLDDVWRPSKILHYWDRPEYREESWNFGKTCCHSNSSEKHSANAGVENSQKNK